MKNFEVYVDKLIEGMQDTYSCGEIYEMMFDKRCEVDEYYEISSEECCERCIFKCGVKQFLLADYVEPIHLSHDEYVILKNLDSEWKYIRRHRDNTLHLCNHNNFMGSNYCVIEMKCFNHLFQFIKTDDEEPYEIAKLIADYEKENGNEKD